MPSMPSGILSQAIGATDIYREHALHGVGNSACEPHVRTCTRAPYKSGIIRLLLVFPNVDRQFEAGVDKIFFKSNE